MKIYAIKRGDRPEQIVKVFNSLKNGEGRFGWSYVETADLRVLQERIERGEWELLSKEEKDCYHGFLLFISMFPSGGNAL